MAAEQLNLLDLAAENDPARASKPPRRRHRRPAKSTPVDEPEVDRTAVAFDDSGVAVVHRYPEGVGLPARARPRRHSGAATAGSGRRDDRGSPGGPGQHSRRGRAARVPVQGQRPPSAAPAPPGRSPRGASDYRTDGAAVLRPAPRRHRHRRHPPRPDPLTEGDVVIQTLAAQASQPSTDGCTRPCGTRS